MGCRVNAYRTTDPDVISPVVMSCWDTIAEDGYSAEGWAPDTLRNAWIAVEDAGVVMAVLSAFPETAGLISVHPHVAPAYRHRRYDIGQVWIEWLRLNTPYRGLVTYIPVSYPHVFRFAKGLGFINVGRLRRAFRKHGELHDMHVMQLELEDDNEQR